MLFRQLEYLVALSRERHFARAAQACSVSQPTLSQAIHKLEDEFAVPLVKRGRRFEGLTTEGERIVLWAQRILADREALKEEVNALRRGLSGELRIGTIPTASVAVPWLSEPFCAEHPLASVQIFADLPANELLRRLTRFDIDAGVTYIDDHLPKNVRAVPLYRERYVLLTDSLSSVAVPETVTWAEASRLPLCLLSPVMQGRRMIDAQFARAGVAAAPQVQTDSIAALYAHVRTRRWASIVPLVWLHVFGLPTGMRWVPLVEPERGPAVGLVITDREPGSVLGRALADLARRIDIADRAERLPERTA